MKCIAIPPNSGLKERLIDYCNDDKVFIIEASPEEFASVIRHERTEPLEDVYDVDLKKRTKTLFRRWRSMSFWVNSVDVGMFIYYVCPNYFECYYLHHNHIAWVLNQRGIIKPTIKEYLKDKYSTYTETKMAHIDIIHDYHWILGRVFTEMDLKTGKIVQELDLRYVEIPGSTEIETDIQRLINRLDFVGTVRIEKAFKEILNGEEFLESDKVYEGPEDKFIKYGFRKPSKIAEFLGVSGKKLAPLGK